MVKPGFIIIKVYHIFIPKSKLLIDWMNEQL